MSLASSILDSNLEDLADLPEFLTPPAGAYRATILSYTPKEIGGHEAVEVKFKLLETLELTNPVDESDPNTKPVADGTETSIAFMLDNEFGVGALKKFNAPLAASLGVNTVREVMEGAKGLEVLIVTKVRVSKKDDRRYFDVAKIDVI